MALLFPKLRSHFAEFLSESYLNASACSASPPVSVCGTITFLLVRSFSSQCELSFTYLLIKIGKLITPQNMILRIFLQNLSRKLKMAIQNPSKLILLRHSITQTLKVVQEYLTCFPLPTPIGLGLGID